MSSQVAIKKVLPRKIISASIAGSIFVILLGVFVPNPFGGEMNTVGEYLLEFVGVVPMYLLYSFPVILIYGTVSSIISDYLSNFISRNYGNKTEVIISALFHIIFGLILLWISLTASIVYFLVDRYLSRGSRVYKWGQAIRSLAIPFLVFIVFWGIVSLADFIENWRNYLV
ncbi:hypothetical protein ACQKP0_20245 [Heyndrickxia sp. NPDC080065]|uniref:hypothetical protein n=1 Tax=Heyndrickxia sp. NPDC080065 TaxID=3390568 RepID=UPI003D087B7D